MFVFFGARNYERLQNVKLSHNLSKLIFIMCEATSAICLYIGICIYDGWWKLIADKHPSVMLRVLRLYCLSTRGPSATSLSSTNVLWRSQNTTSWSDHSPADHIWVNKSQSYLFVFHVKQKYRLVDHNIGFLKTPDISIGLKSRVSFRLY